MRGNVEAAALNVRSLPNITGRVLGRLAKNTVVNILDESAHWFEINYHQHRAFVSRHYVKTFDHEVKLNGLVTASLLNVRRAPSSTTEIIGTLVGGSQVSIIEQWDRWLEIEFNEITGFVFGDFVDFYTPKDSFFATVNTGLLNVRALPNTRASIVGQLTYQTKVEVVAAHQKWAEIRFSGQVAFVYMDYLETVPSDESKSIEHEESAEDEQAPPHLVEPANPMAPAIKLPVTGSGKQIKVARTWNQFGGLLKTLCDERSIEVACAVAVLCVESSGKGFEQNNHNRMIIRFENHKFWKYWGKTNPKSFRQHFKYSPEKVWTQHKWRRSTDDAWQSFHGSQRKEWQVFEFAKSLNADAAMLSISMGAPQIMGFHFERIAYESVAEMFHDFSQSAGAHVEGLFGFFSKSMIRNLQNRDFESFAAKYNGSGQKEKYGRWINEHYQAFQAIFNR